MRVLDLNTLWIDGGEGGVNTYLREKARWLAESSVLRGRSLSHGIVVPGARTERARLGTSAVYTVKSPRLPGNPQHRVLIDFRAVSEILREVAPDVVEVDTSYLLGHVASRALKPRRPSIVGFYHVHLPKLYSRAGRSWLRTHLTRRTEGLAWKYTELCANPCDCVVVTTHDMCTRLEGRSFPRLELVPLGVNLDLFTPRIHGARPHFPGVDPSRPVVLYVGRLGREKDLDVLFDAHAQLEPESGIQLLLAGDGPLRQKAQRFARARRGVIYAGMFPYGERLAELYRAADVLAVPSRNETFSLIVLEAFASGVPVVAANEGGPSELLRGGHGSLAQAGDANDFASKLRGAIESREDGARVRGHAVARYSWEKTFTRLLEVYDSVLEQRSASRPPLEALPLEHVLH